MDLLTHILGYTRQSNSEGLRLFDAWLKSYIEGLGHKFEADGYGNLWVVTDAAASTLFTCHTDTVHYGVPAATQDLKLENGILSLATPASGYVLGADDGAGVWLLLKMIDAGVRGTFVFYSDEEVGGLGSEWSAQNEPERYKGFKRAVAFDRKDVCSVITHQFGGRCCSEAFANALCTALAMGHAPDSTGSFTDTANLTHLVSECTNVSIGYWNAHTSSEYLDTVYLQRLLQALVQTDWETLPVERDPASCDYGYGSDFEPWLSDDDASGYSELECVRQAGLSYAQELVYGSPEYAAALLLWCAENL